MLSWSGKRTIRPPLLLLAMVETLILFSSIYVAGIFVFGSYAEGVRLLDPIVPKAITIAFVIFLSLISTGLYQFSQRLYFRETVVRLMVGLAIGCLGLAVVFYAFPKITVDHDIAGIAIGYALVLLLVVRFYFVRHVDENMFRRKTLIYGAGERAAAIFDLRRRADRRGFKIVGQVAAQGDMLSEAGGLPQTNGKKITDFAIESGADEIVVAMDDRRGNLPIRDLLNAKLRGIDVVDLHEFLERESGKIRADLVQPGWLIFSPGFRMSQMRQVNKRLIDLAASASIVALVWPIMLLIWLAIKIEDGLKAPVFYRQSRIGSGGTEFDVFKFRSMRTDAEADGKAVWASKNDSRITRVGACLRKSRLDELPQVLNVLKGNMSLVGPRPERPEFVRHLEDKIPYYSERHSVKPGVTGWAQLKYSYGASDEDALEKLHYDLYYIKNQSMILDLVILLQTVEVVLFGKGAR